MTREERCKLAIEKGYTYNQESGKVYSRFGNEIKSKFNTGYIQMQIYINKKRYDLLGHHFAWYWVNKECVNCLDHINGIKTDNCISNLRSVTHQQNHMNRTTAKGYHWHKSKNKWKASIKLNGKTIHLGLFNTEEDARAAYITAKEKYHII